MHKRDRLAQMAFLTIATWMLPITTTGAFPLKERDIV